MPTLREGKYSEDLIRLFSYTHVVAHDTDVLLYQDASRTVVLRKVIVRIIQGADIPPSVQGVFFKSTKLNRELADGYEHFPIDGGRLKGQRNVKLTDAEVASAPEWLKSHIQTLTNIVDIHTHATSVPEKLPKGDATALYLKSDPSKPVDELSISNQQELCAKFCEQQGLEVVRIVSDIRGQELSAADELPTGITELCSRIRAGEFQHVVIETPNRLERRLARFTRYYDALTNAGADVHFANMSLKEQEHALLLVMGAGHLIADLTSTQSERIKAGRLRNARAKEKGL